MRHRLTTLLLAATAAATAACGDVDPAGPAVDDDGMRPAAPSLATGSSFALLRSTALNVVSESDAGISAILDGAIGSDRVVLSFNGLATRALAPGAFDDRLIANGVRIEGVSGSVRVGGSHNSGGVAGTGHLGLGIDFLNAVVRVHFVEPGTTTPTTVRSVGGFTSSPDFNRNCIDFFDASGTKLGGGCVQHGNWSPVTRLEFLGAEAADGIASIVVSTRGIPFELDLLSFPAPAAPEPVNQAPVADAGDDRVVECDAAGCGEVVLDGSGSSDPDGDALTYTWYDEAGTEVGSGATAALCLGVGRHTLTLVVSDGTETSSDEVVIDVVDHTAPTVSLTATPPDRWPPNGRYVTVAVDASALDACDDDLAIVGAVQSSEPDDGRGAGKTTGDIRVTRPDGSVLLSSNANPAVPFNPLTDVLEVRAERAGNGNGRTYTISLTATDDGGNAATTTAAIHVAHDRGRK